MTDNTKKKLSYLPINMIFALTTGFGVYFILHDLLEISNTNAIIISIIAWGLDTLTSTNFDYLDERITELENKIN